MTSTWSSSASAWYVAWQRPTPNCAPKLAALSAEREATATSSASGVSRSPAAKALAILPVPRIPQRITLFMSALSAGDAASWCHGLPLGAEHGGVVIKLLVLTGPPAGNAQHRQRREVGGAQAVRGQVLRHARIEPCAAAVVIEREELVAGEDDAGVRGDGLARRDQLFHQRVAEQPDLRIVAKAGTLPDQRGRPLMAAQRLHQGGAGIAVAYHQQRGVFVEDGGAVACGTARFADAGQRDLRGLQGVELAFDERKAKPHQAVEEVVQIVARRHAAGGADMLFVRSAVGQRALRHER